MEYRVVKKENNIFIKISLELISFIIWLTGCVLITLGIILLKIFMIDYFFIKNFIYLLSIINILIGCILFVCGILAIYYVIRKNFIIGGIVFYILILTSLSIIILVVVSVVLYQNGFIEKYFHENVKENYANSTKFVDMLQTNFRCCGLKNYTEWKHRMSDQIGKISEFYLSQDRLSYSLPDSCCIKKEIDCAKYFPSVKAIHKQACQPILDKLLHNLLKQMMLISSISLVIIICTIFFISYVSLFTNGSYDILEKSEKKSKSNISTKNDEYVSSESALLND